MYRCVYRNGTLQWTPRLKDRCIFLLCRVMKRKVNLFTLHRARIGQTPGGFSPTLTFLWKNCIKLPDLTVFFHVFSWTHEQIRARTHARTRARVRTHTHTHTHTHTQYILLQFGNACFGVSLTHVICVISLDTVACSRRRNVVCLLSINN